MTELRQLELFGTRTDRSPAALADWLGQGLAAPLCLTFTRNKVAMASVRRGARGLALRLDHAFLAAPDRVLAALRDYLRRGDRAAWRIVGEFARTIQPAPASPRRLRLVSRGRVYDLAAIRDRVNRQYFSGRLVCRIAWGRAAAQRCRRRARSRSIRFGSYVRAENLVRINPRLDDARVPEAFVEHIVFHEMLHAVVPSRGGRRWSHHHAAFRALERRHPEFEAMRRMTGAIVDLLTGHSRRRAAPAREC